MAIPVIYKGDDTDFRGSTGFTLKVVTSSNLNLSGCTVEVEVLGFRRSFPASATGELVCPFAFSAAETRRMPLGIHAATVRVFDSKGRVRTINNSIRVKVTNSVHEAYDNDDPQEVTLAVSTVDLEAYAKKADVTAAITAALKDAGASVKLQALTPEVTDTTVTLKPVDGKANWVEGTVTAGSPGKRAFRIVAYCEAFYVDYENEDNLTVKWKFEFSDKNSEIVAIRKFEDPVLVIQLTDYVTGTVTKSDPPYVSDGEYPLELFKGYEIEFYLGGIDLSEGEFDWGSTDLNSESFSADIYGSTLFESLQYTFPTFIQGGGHAYNMESGGTGEGSYVEHTAPKTSAAFSICLPGSTGPARHVSLALTTDVTTETDATWEGADEIIEAFPGASKLVPGLNVWDVSEVAPGKFRVERASSPAQSAPLTLTAPNGRVAELTVGDDLVLEVKEK